MEDATEGVSALPKPGVLIKQTREKRELSIDDLSDRTRLTENVLLQVESDNFQALGEPVYARGYYRKCGEALGLNGERLVEAYEHHSGTGSPVPVIEQRPSIAYRDGPGKTALGMAIGLMAILFGLSGLWLWEDDAEHSTPVVAVTQSDVEPAPSAVLASSQPEQSEPPEVPVAMQSTMQDATPSAVDGEEIESAQEGDPKGSALTTNSAELGAEPEGTLLPEAQAGEFDQQQVAEDPNTKVASQPIVLLPRWGKQAPVELASVSQGRVAAPESTAPLMIEIEGGEAWVEIYAQSGERLLYKLLQAGSVREVRSAAPYRFELGRADHVRVRLNGRYVDISSQIRSDARASFWLDAQGRILDDTSEAR